MLKWSMLSLLCMTVFYIIFVQLQLQTECPVSKLTSEISKPKVLIYDTNSNSGHLDLVKSVFLRLGFNVNVRSTIDLDWHVLWSHPYPFYTFRNELSTLREHQKVNHFPGSGFITQKSNLISLYHNFIPKAFEMPEQKAEFLNFSKTNLNKLFVQKSNSHRGIKILNAEDLDLNNKGTFIQEYVANPLLVSNRKFDIGVYVVLTSINPLRVYEYSGDVLLRFCAMDYHPFNSSAIESYVVGDDYTPIWEIPALKKLYGYFNYTAKDSLNAYLQSKNKDPKKLWLQISQALRDVYIAAMQSIAEKTMEFGNGKNFFELVRFDFMVDEDLKVFLLEANMSPNLSSAHFPPNKLLYEQVLFNVFSLIGLSLKFSSAEIHENEFQVSEKDIQVCANRCSEVCSGSCKMQKCQICNHCMTRELKLEAQTSYMEQMNRNKFRRLVPFPSEYNSNNQIEEKSLPGNMNMFMSEWFKEKCAQDFIFCS